MPAGIVEARLHAQLAHVAERHRRAELFERRSGSRPLPSRLFLKQIHLSLQTRRSFFG
jgi:hypothetical protein